MASELRIPCSYEQGEVLAEHLLNGSKLVMVPREREYLVRKVAKLRPGSKIVSAHLDTDGTWLLHFDSVQVSQTDVQ